MPEIIISEGSIARTTLFPDVMADLALTDGSDFVLVSRHEDVMRYLTAGDRQLIIFGSSPNGLESLEEIVSEAQEKNPEVVIIGFFAEDPGSLRLDLCVDPKSVSGPRAPLAELKSAIGDFRCGRLVSQHA